MNGIPKNHIAMDNPEYHMMNRRNAAMAAVAAASMQQRNGYHKKFPENPGIPYPPHLIESKRRTSQRSSHSSQPHTPTDPYFPASTSDPNFAGLPRTPTDTTSSFRLPSLPTTPTSPHFPAGSSRSNGDAYFPWNGARPNDPKVFHGSHQTVGVPVLEPHSRLPSYSSTGSSGPNSCSTAHHNGFHKNGPSGSRPEPSHEYYNDLSRGYSSLQSGGHSSTRSETTV